MVVINKFCEPIYVIIGIFEVQNITGAAMAN
jgi:hypothetical protein